MSDCDYGLIILADVMDGEVVPYGKKFSECISRATKKESACAIFCTGTFFCIPQNKRGCEKNSQPLVIGRGGGI